MRLLTAFVIGLLAATIPLVAVATREGCTSEQSPEDAPRYLVLTSAATMRSLRCGPAGGSVALERVRSGAEASARIEDERVAGIIFDRSALEALPGGTVREWLGTGSGRVLVGLQMTHWEVELYFTSPPAPRESLRPDQRGESTDLEGRPYLTRMSFQALPSGGTCAGTGTVVHTRPEVLASILVQTARGCGSGPAAGQHVPRR
jgi:hypothetical protein